MSDIEDARVASARSLRVLAQTFTPEQHEKWEREHHPNFVALINAMGTVTSETVDELVEKLSCWAHGAGARWYGGLTFEQQAMVKTSVADDKKRSDLIDRRRARISGLLGFLDLSMGSIATVAGFLAGLPAALFVPLAMGLLVALVGGWLGARGSITISVDPESFARSRRLFPRYVAGWIVLGVLGIGTTHIVAAIIWGALGAIAINRVVQTLEDRRAPE
jgi:hypothetical protein